MAGAAGGNLAGSLLKQYNLGTLGNSIAGIVGGGLGGQLLGMLIESGRPAAGWILAPSSRRWRAAAWAAAS